MPTYNNTIPLSSDPPSIFPAQAQQNFQLIESVIGADHITFNTAGAGFHNQSTYVVQGINPTSAAGQVVHFAKTVGANSEEFIKRDAPGTIIQMTSGLANQGTSFLFGQSFLPGGFQIKWGNEQVTNGIGITYTAASRGLNNFPNKTIAVIITPNTNVAGITVSAGGYTTVNTGFTVYVAGAANPFVSWLAIGY